MPGFDGTGPRGMGPMTGHGGGYCIIPLNAPEQELNFWKNQAKFLRDQLGQTEVKIKGIKASGVKSAKGVDYEDRHYN